MLESVLDNLLRIQFWACAHATCELIPGGYTLQAGEQSRSYDIRKLALGPAARQAIILVT